MEQKTKIIGTTEYAITQMDAISALKIQTKIIKVLGGGALELIGGGDTKNKIANIAPKLFENFNDDVVNEIVLKLFEKNVFVKNKGHNIPIDFATHFAGKLNEMWQVAAFILEVNFAMGELVKSDLNITKAENLTPKNI